jgi:hypothetical protein
MTPPLPQSVLALKAGPANLAGSWGGGLRGVGVTGLVYPDSFIPLSGYSGRWILSGNTVKEQLPGSPAVALTGRTSPRAALRARYGADLNAPSRTLGVALPSGLLAPAMADSREEQRKAGVSWRCDGR